MKVFFPGHHLSLLTVQPLLEGLSSFMTVDSAPSPSASRRMTGGGGRHAVKSGSFGLENPTERRSVSMWIDLLMMLCVLVLD